MLIKKYYVIIVLFLSTILYFSPALTFNKIIMGTDDGSRGWLETGNIGHKIKSFLNPISPVNGGSIIIENRYGRFLNPTHSFHLILPKYKARVLEYMFWTLAAGIGMFLYLRILGLIVPISLCGALIFMFAPAFQSFVFAGHFARMEVIALMPWILWVTERMIIKASLSNMVWLPILIALSVYSEHLQMAFFVFIGMAFYFAICIIYLLIKKELSFRKSAIRTTLFCVAVMTGGLLSAMNFIPAMQHTAETSKRAGGVDFEYASSFSLHPEEMFSLLEPDFIGWKEYYWGQNSLKLNSEYFGVCVLLLAILGFLIKKPDFKRWFFAGFFVFGILYTLGAHTPFFKLFYLYFPGINSFRGPSQTFIWFFLPGIVLAMYALQDLLTIKRDENPKLQKRLLLFGGVTGGFALIYLMATTQFGEFWYSSFYPMELKNDQKHQIFMYQMAKNARLGAFVIMLVIGMFFGLIYLRIKNRITTATFLIAFGALCLFDLVRVSRPFFTQSLRSAGSVLRQEGFEHSIAQYLSQNDPSDPKTYRTYSMLGDQKMYISGLDFTYIFDDFINKRYYDIIEPLLSISYYLQQPGYENNQQIQTDFVNTLSILNTKYILTTTELAFPQLRQVIVSGAFRIYENLNCLPRFYLSSIIIPVSDTKEHMLKSLRNHGFTRDSVIVDAAVWQDKKLDPGQDAALKDSVLIRTYDPWKGRADFEIHSSRRQMLVMLENFDKGWKARVSGAPAQVYPVNHFSRGVIVPKGKSTVELEYRSESATKWINITTFSAFVFLGYILGLLL